MNRFLVKSASVGRCLVCLVAANVALNSAAVAQVSAAFDRTKPPRLAKAARLTVPVHVAATLENGMSIRVVTQRELPVVQVTAVIEGGARLDGGQVGIATFVANMLDEGAGGRDAAALQSEFAFLGASLGARADWDAITVSLKVPVRSLEPALALMADVVQRPSFATVEVRRQRDLRLANLLQVRDQPNTLASLAFDRVVFPEGHPYHQPLGGDSASTARLDSAMVRAFYSQTVRPERSTFFVVGDIAAADARALLARFFGNWRGSGPSLAARPIVVRPKREETPRLYLVDKPEAAQSVITIGWPGVDRRSPDYAAVTVMNTLLGGSFTSRLNMNLRETKGFSYGARSGFAFRKTPGPFTASAAVRTNVTDSSLVEFFKELRAIRDTRVPADELERGKAYVELGLPGTLEGTSQVAAEMAELANFGLTLAELPRFAAAVRRVTAADVQRVARQYLTPDRATIVVVGDLAKVRAPIQTLGLGSVTLLEVRQVAR
jgi:predicted Zn-dependent peptidase